MDSSNPEICLEVLPYVRVHKNGTIERLAGTQVVPPGHDSETNVFSKDILLIPETGVSARLYRPKETLPKLPLVIYFHGGAFCISSASDPLYHGCLNRVVAEAKVVAISVNYRLAPENPLPTAYQDSWAALELILSHAREDGKGHESWLDKEVVDFERVFLAGDSAGANIANYMTLRLHDKVRPLPAGLIMVNPYYWGKEPIGVEATDLVRKEMVDKWWDFVCPSDKGNDDPLINPFVDGAPSLENLRCEVIVVVAEKDILKDRGKLYHKKLVNSGWKGKAQLYEIEGEDHVFHIFDPNCDKAKALFQRLASFINEPQQQSNSCE